MNELPNRSVGEQITERTGARARACSFCPGLGPPLAGAPRLRVRHHHPIGVRLPDDGRRSWLAGEEEARAGAG
jgi:hypothetical protein